MCVVQGDGGHAGVPDGGHQGAVPARGAGGPARLHAQLQPAAALRPQVQEPQGTGAGSRGGTLTEMLPCLIQQKATNYN